MRDLHTVPTVPTHSDSERQFRTVGEVAAMIGVHPETVKRYARRGELAAVQLPGKQWRFAEADIAAFIERHRSVTR